MAQVFISYSTADSKQAMQIVDYLEAHGISCWTPHRNITPGAIYSEVIPKAIRECHVFLLLISKNSVESSDVHTELALAVRKKGRLILPLLLEDVFLPDTFNYFLFNTQTYLYYQDPKAALEKICRDLYRFLPDSAPPLSAKAIAGDYMEATDRGRKSIASWIQKAGDPLHSQKPAAETTKTEQDSSFHQGMEYYCKGLEYYIAVDYPNAAECFRKSADLGYVKSMFYLGFCFHYGYGIRKDMRQAVDWYRKAAEQHHAQAQFYLAACCEHGDGIAMDAKAAVMWYREAAEQGHIQAQYALGVCCEKGNGVRKNAVQAVAWYQKAAEQGYAQAKYALGACYQNGTGVPQNYKTALSWYRKAAAQDSARAQYALGVCYENGYGVDQNHETAFSWYMKAAEAGLETAMKKVNQLRVFISYSSREEQTANEIMEALESHGIRCWIAPRDVPIGYDYMTSIPDGIEGCAFFVLVLSDISQDSVWVRKELSQAIKQRKEILPLRIQNCAISKGFEFALDNVQIRDYYRDKDAVIQEVITIIHNFPVQSPSAPAQETH